VCRVLCGQLELQNVGSGLILNETVVPFELTHEWDSLDAVPVTRVELLDRDLLLLDFPMNGSMSSAILRYAFRNDPCPDRLVRCRPVR
jgi:hypothetical protein